MESEFVKGVCGRHRTGCESQRQWKINGECHNESTYFFKVRKGNAGHVCYKVVLNAPLKNHPNMILVVRHAS